MKQINELNVKLRVQQSCNQPEALVFLENYPKTQTILSTKHHISGHLYTKNIGVLFTQVSGTLAISFKLRT